VSVPAVVGPTEMHLGNVVSQRSLRGYVTVRAAGWSVPTPRAALLGHVDGLLRSSNDAETQQILIFSNARITSTHPLCKAKRHSTRFQVAARDQDSHGHAKAGKRHNGWANGGSFPIMHDIAISFDAVDPPCSVLSQHVAQHSRG